MSFVLFGDLYTQIIYEMVLFFNTVLQQLYSFNLLWFIQKVVAFKYNNTYITVWISCIRRTVVIINLKFRWVCYERVSIIDIISGLLANIIVSNSLLVLIRLSAFVYITDELYELALKLFRIFYFEFQDFQNPEWAFINIHSPTYLSVQALFSLSITFCMHYALP